MGYLKDPPNVDLLDVEYETREMERVSSNQSETLSASVGNGDLGSDKLKSLGRFGKESTGQRLCRFGLNSRFISFNLFVFVLPPDP